VDNIPLKHQVQHTKLSNDVEIAQRKVETAKKAAAGNQKRDKEWWYQQQVDNAETKFLTEQNKLLALEAQIEVEEIKKQATKQATEKRDTETAEKVGNPFKDLGIRRHDYVGDWYAKYGEEWCRITEGEATNYLAKEHYISDKTEDEGELLSPAAYALQNAIGYWKVDYVGNFAGYLKEGEYAASNGGKILVTKGRKLIEAKKGDHSFITSFLKGCFSRPDQFEAYCGWQLAADVSLQKPIGCWDHGQALLLVGGAGNGKSAFQQDFIDAMLTNHHADATCFLKGESTFNSELGEAEHWLMDDPRSSSQKEKDSYIAGVKKAIATVWLFIHPKGKTPLNLPTYRRLTISLNEEDSALHIISDLEPSELEKILALNFENAGKYAPNGVGGLPYPEWKAKIQEQLPAFKWWLHNEFVLPEHLKHPRYGVQYTNPDLQPKLAAPTQKERDADLEEMILGCCFEKQAKVANTQRMDWFPADNIELTSSEVNDRLLSLRNPGRTRAMKMLETRSTRKMTTWLTRLSSERKGQRNGFHLKRNTPKDEHVSFIFNRGFRPSNNGDTEERSDHSDSPPTTDSYLMKHLLRKDL
jgi:hypothetical protein